MKIVSNSYVIQYPQLYEDWEKEKSNIESAGRVSRLSSLDDSDSFIKKLMSKGHLSVLEFGHMRVKFNLSRYLTHELVRHRHCSFIQESTRYCNYAHKEDELTDITVISPQGLVGFMGRWITHCQQGEKLYGEAIKAGIAPEFARAFLPPDLAATIVVDANMREWRHIFRLRCAKAAHPALRSVMLDLYSECLVHAPAVFEGAYEKEEEKE